MDDRLVRRHLTATRLLVIEILGDLGYATSEQIVDAWLERRPNITPAHRSRLPRMRDETLWRLVNLGWAVGDENRYTLTDAGRRVCAAHSARA